MNINELEDKLIRLERYSIYSGGVSFFGGYDMFPEEDGQWIKWSDIELLIGSEEETHNSGKFIRIGLDQIEGKNILLIEIGYNIYPVEYSEKTKDFLFFVKGVFESNKDKTVNYRLTEDREWPLEFLGIDADDMAKAEQKDDVIAYLMK